VGTIRLSESDLGTAVLHILEVFCFYKARGNFAGVSTEVTANWIPCGTADSTAVSGIFKIEDKLIPQVLQYPSIRISYQFTEYVCLPPGFFTEPRGPVRGTTPLVLKGLPSNSHKNTAWAALCSHTFCLAPSTTRRGTPHNQHNISSLHTTIIPLFIVIILLVPTGQVLVVGIVVR